MANRSQIAGIDCCRLLDFVFSGVQFFCDFVYVLVEHSDTRDGEGLLWTT